MNEMIGISYSHLTKIFGDNVKPGNYKSFLPIVQSNLSINELDKPENEQLDFSSSQSMDENNILSTSEYGTIAEMIQTNLGTYTNKDPGNPGNPGNPGKSGESGKRSNQVGVVGQDEDEDDQDNQDNQDDQDNQDNQDQEPEPNVVNKEALVTKVNNVIDQNIEKNNKALDTVEIVIKDATKKLEDAEANKLIADKSGGWFAKTTGQSQANVNILTAQLEIQKAELDKAKLQNNIHVTKEVKTKLASNSDLNSLTVFTGILKDTFKLEAAVDTTEADKIEIQKLIEAQKFDDVEKLLKQQLENIEIEKKELALKNQEGIKKIKDPIKTLAKISEEDEGDEEDEADLNSINIQIDDLAGVMDVPGSSRDNPMLPNSILKKKNFIEMLDESRTDDSKVIDIDRKQKQAEQEVLKLQTERQARSNTRPDPQRNISRENVRQVEVKSLDNPAEPEQEQEKQLANANIIKRERANFTQEKNTQPVAEKREPYVNRFQRKPLVESKDTGDVQRQPQKASTVKGSVDDTDTSTRSLIKYNTFTPVKSSKKKLPESQSGFKDPDEDDEFKDELEELDNVPINRRQYKIRPPDE